MESPTQRSRNGLPEEHQEPRPSEPIPTPPVTNSADPESKPEDEGNTNKPYPRKASNRPSLIGSAQIQLRLFVEEVKVELKELTQPGDDMDVDWDDSRGHEVAVGGHEVVVGGHEVVMGGNPINIKKKLERTGWRRYIGIILGITSSMLFALCIIIVKLMPGIYPANITLWRFQGLLWPAVVIGLYCRVVKKEKIFDIMLPISAKGHPKTLFFLFLRGLAGATAAILQIYTLQFISVGDSTVIAFSTPVFVSVASHFLLGEKSGFVPIICGVITLAGVVIITRPPILTGGEAFDDKTLIGSGLALGVMICSVFIFLLVRYLRQMHFSILTGYFGLWGSIQSVALTMAVSEIQYPEDFHQWMMALALAILTFIAQVFVTLALKYEQAGTVSLCRTCDILFAYLWQFIFLGVVPDQYSMIGGGIVTFGIVVAALRKYLSDLPEESQARKRWWILLT